MRKLNKREENQLAALTASNAEIALLEITETGLNKSIMDATRPIRALLADTGIHDYSAQRQGTDNKVLLDAVIHDANDAMNTKASLYRPETKMGDPRIWFYKLKSKARSGDILAIIPHLGILHLLNITQLDVQTLSQQQGHSLELLLSAILRETSHVSDELLGKLRELAMRGPIRSVVEAPADTAIGRTLEHQLGIAMNSNKAPDYKGIELKSFRKRSRSRQVRKNLFAQVPDWSLSEFKSSGEILDAFGYVRGDDFKLYCQVDATKRNSQGLMLKLDAANNYLLENSEQIEIGDFATWRLEALHKRLLQKHAETFWVGAKQLMDNGVEYFQFTDVTHTRKPITSQFDILVDQGIITMDHLIKRAPGKSAKEKGPLFKIEANSLDLLFPPPRHYSLLAA